MSSHALGEGLILLSILLAAGLGSTLLYKSGKWLHERYRAAVTKQDKPLMIKPDNEPDTADLPAVEEETAPRPPYEEPLEYWRREVMPKVTDIPVALMFNGAPVVEGDLLQIGEGRQVKVLSTVPDSETGGIMVQENFLADPAQLGCTLREEQVILQMSPDEARELLAYYRSQHAARNIGPQTDETGRFARPVFDELETVFDERK